MDMLACRKNRMVKEIKIDQHLINSLLTSSAKKLKSQKFLKLDGDTASSKITLIYDSMREILEALAISKGYKIYNHECYTAFLKEIMKEPNFGDSFDSFRKIRNDINYYGRDIPAKDAKALIDSMVEFTEKLKAKFFNRLSD